MSITRFAAAMGFVALAILDLERRQLQGVLVWHWARHSDEPLAINQ